MHHHARSHDLTVAVLRHLGQHQLAHDLENSLWKKISSKHGGNKTRARVRGTQPSGRGDTTLSNSFVVGNGCVVIAHRATDKVRLEAVIYNVFWNMGFLVETTTLPPQSHPLEVEYLQERYYKTAESHVRMPGNRIGRILLRTFWTKDRLSDVKSLRLMRGIALSLYAKNAHVPISNDLLWAIIEQTQGVSAHLDRERVQNIRWQYEGEIPVWANRVIVRKAGFPEAYTEHPDTESELAEVLNVTVGQIRLLRTQCKTVRMGSLLGAGCDDILLKLAAWDL
jgi:hypothetical protein